MDFHLFYLKRRGRGKGVETGSGFEEELPDDWDSTGVWWEKRTRRLGDGVTKYRNAFKGNG